MSHIHSVVYWFVGYASCIIIASYRVGNDAVCGGIYYRDSIRTAICHIHLQMYWIVGYAERIKTYWYITNNAVCGSVYYCDSTGLPTGGIQPTFNVQPIGPKFVMYIVLCIGLGCVIRGCLPAGIGLPITLFVVVFITETVLGSMFATYIVLCIGS